MDTIDPTLPPPTEDIEREAIAVLARDGWWGGDSERSTPDGSCLYVTMARTGYGTVAAFDAAVKRVGDVIREQYPERVAGKYKPRGESLLFRFNDAPETTVDDVILVLEKAALRRDEASA